MTEAPGIEAPATEAAFTPPLRPCLVVDVLWEAFTEEGALAFEEERPGDALTLWQVAERMAAAFADADPRRAASLANLAAAMDAAVPPSLTLPRKGGGNGLQRAERIPPPLAGGGRGRGEARLDISAHSIEAQYRRALACWDRVPLWIERMAPDHKPHSSLYHHRLERKYAGAYAEIARRGHRRLAEGGRAACLGNLAGLLHRLGRTDEAVSLYRDAVTAREPALGARDVGAMHLSRNLADLLSADGRTEEAEAARAKAEAIAANHPLTPRRRWRSEKPVRMSDTRRLLAAVYLTPVIRRR